MVRAIQSFDKTLFYYLPSARDHLGSDQVNQIALHVLKDAASVAFILAASVPFMLAGKVLLIGAGVGIIGYNLATKVALSTLHNDTIDEIDSKWKPFFTQCMTQAGHFLTGLTIGALITMTLEILFHELGHFVAYKLLMTGDVKVVLESFTGGYTAISNGQYSPLGLMLGARNSDFLISAGGPLFSLIFILGAILVGHFTADKPYVRTAANWTAFISMLETAAYALSAFGRRPSSGHDFVAMAAFGLNPLVATGIIVLLPLLFKASLCLIDKTFTRP